MKNLYSAKMALSAHKTAPQNRTQTMWFHPFVFTGKERDEEMGYGYFGARYMDHELMTMWLSIDPMADKYPNISSYAYCAWNPIRLVDPNGQDTFNINIATGHVDYRYDVNRGKDVVSVYKNNIHVLTLPCSGRVEYLGPSGATIYNGKKYYTHGLKFHDEKDGRQIFIGIWNHKGSQHNNFFKQQKDKYRP